MFNTYSFLKSGLREIVQQRARYTTYSMSALHIPRLFLETVVIVDFMLLVMMLTGSNMPRRDCRDAGSVRHGDWDTAISTASIAPLSRQRSAYIDTRIPTGWTDIRIQNSIRPTGNLVFPSKSCVCRMSASVPQYGWPGVTGD